MIFTAIEKRSDVIAALAMFKAKFATNAEHLPYRGIGALWHPKAELWAIFGETEGKAGSPRPWNAFGHNPISLRKNIVVEINQPRAGIDLNIQSIFATDENGDRWVLHQGRMSIRGKAIREDDFVAATSLQPVNVSFKDGQSRPFHPVAMIDASASRVQATVGTFVRHCAGARAQFLADPRLGKALKDLLDEAHVMTPEKGGTYETAPRGSTIAKRHHADVVNALSVELTRRGIEHANTRVERYGPDCFTLVRPFVLFEIKTRVEAHDVFEGFGQLSIYEKLLKRKFTKVLVMPDGMGDGLRPPLAALGIPYLRFAKKGRKIVFDADVLDACFAGDGKRG